MTNQTENDKLVWIQIVLNLKKNHQMLSFLPNNQAELTKRFEQWQGKIDSENEELKAHVKELKSQVEELTKKLKSKHEETSDSNCSSPKQQNTISRKKSQNKSTKDAQLSCEDLRKRGHFADGIYLVEHPMESKKTQAVYCQFKGAGNSKIQTRFQL